MATTLMRRRWLLLVTLGVLLLFSSTAALAKVKLVVVNRYHRADEANAVSALLDRFEEMHPEVEIEELFEHGDMVEKLTALWLADEAPDVWDHGGPVATYEHNGWLLDLTPYVERDREELNLADYFPTAWEAYALPNFTRGLPFMSAPTFAFYNVTLLNEAGLVPPPIDWNDESWTVEQLEVYGKKMTKLRPDGSVERYGLGFATGHLENVVYPRLTGGGWFGDKAWETGLVEQLRFEDPKTIEGYQAFVDMVVESRIATTGFWGEWFNGRIGMLVGPGPWTVMGQQSAINFPWGMAPMPRNPYCSTVVYTDAWMVSSKTKHPEMAWELVKFLTSNQALVQYSKSASFPPARITATRDAYADAFATFSQYHSPEEILVGLAGAQEYGVESADHMIVGYNEMRSAMEPLMAQMWTGEVSVPETMTKVTQVLRPIIEKYRPSK